MNLFNRIIAALVMYSFVGTLALPISAQTHTSSQSAIPPVLPLTTQAAITQAEKKPANNLAENQFVIDPEKGGNFHYGDFYIDIPSGAIAKPIVITIEKTTNTKALDSGMQSATPANALYRLHPDGTQFSKPVVIGLPYDASVNDEEVVNLSTYVYDEQETCWVKVSKIGVDSKKHIVYSQTTHFSDYINSVLKLPDNPKPLSWNPNSIKDLKAADPSSGITPLQLPKVDSQGVGGLSFPIEIPAGRAGMQPQLALSYSQDAGNGWVGQGWNLMVPSVSIDTKWGAPRFDGTYESETYMVDGQELGPIGHGDATMLYPREADRYFYPLIEKTYSEIQRMGTAPSNYWWKVKSKDGHTRYYGSTGSDPITLTGVIKNSNGNISRWMLVKEEDDKGNFVSYTYSSTSSIAGSTEFYLSSIRYTGFGSDQGAYQVVFERNLGKRADGNIDGRTGTLMYEGELLSDIRTEYIGETPALVSRNYHLTYKTGVFGKSLLEKITAQDKKGGQDFYTYTCTYYDEVAGGSQLFDSNPTMMYSKNSEIAFNVLNVGFTTPSLLGTSINNTIGADVYAGIGAGADVTKKDISVGVKLAYSYSSGDVTSMMVDLNGDGLNDLVYRKVASSQIWYMPQIPGSQGTSFGDPELISGLSTLQMSNCHTFSIGVEATAVISAYGGGNWSWSREYQYFSDINGDGLIDFVTSSEVLYNHIVNGVPIFNSQSADTAFSLKKRSNSMASGITYSAEQKQRKINESPQIDAVRVWTAPYDGKITISGQPQYVLNPNTVAKPEEITSYQHRDGVNVHIQKDGLDWWSDSLTSSQPDPLNPFSETTEISVSKGAHIQFRVNSGKDGLYDVVNWAPEIKYTSIAGTPLVPDDLLAEDINGRLVYRYNAGNDFLVWGNESTYKAVAYGDLHLTGTLTNQKLSDDMYIVVSGTQLEPVDTAHLDQYTPENSTTVGNSSGPKVLWQKELWRSEKIAAGEEKIINLSDIGSIAANPDLSLNVYIETKSDIDQKKIQFNGTWSYISPYNISSDGSHVPLVDQQTNESLVKTEPLKIAFPQFVATDTKPRISGQVYTYNSGTAKTVLSYQLSPSVRSSQDQALTPFTYTIKSLDPQKPNTDITYYYSKKPIHGVVKAFKSAAHTDSGRLLGSFDIVPSFDYPVDPTDSSPSGPLLPAAGTVILDSAVAVGEEIVVEIYPDDSYKTLFGNPTIAFKDISTQIDVEPAGSPDVYQLSLPDDSDVSIAMDILSGPAINGSTARYKLTETTTGEVIKSNQFVLSSSTTPPTIPVATVFSFGMVPKGSYELSQDQATAFSFGYPATINVGTQGIDIAKAIEYFYSPEFSGGLIGGYHNWAVVMYNDMDAGGITRMDQSHLYDEATIKNGYGKGSESATDTSSLWFFSYTLKPQSGNFPGDYWGGVNENCFITSTQMASSRLSDAYPYYEAAIPSTSGFSVAQAIKYSESTGFSAGMIMSAAIGDSKSFNDSMDMNGDGFPDDLAYDTNRNTTIITYTDPTGPLGGKQSSLSGPIRKTHSNNVSIGLGSIAQVVANAAAKGKDSIFTFPSKTGEGKWGLMPNLSVNMLDTGDVNSDFRDINGDGLPDRIEQSSITTSSTTTTTTSLPNGTTTTNVNGITTTITTVNGQTTTVTQTSKPALNAFLNTGYSFSDTPIKLAVGTIDSSSAKPLSGGLSLGFSDFSNSWSGGVSYNLSGSGSNTQLMDVNGDGLVDMITGTEELLGKNQLEVSVNTGIDYQNAITARNAGTRIADFTNVSTSANIGFTVGFTIFGAAKFVVGIGVQYSSSTNTKSRSMQDVDGDGLVDIIVQNPTPVVANQGNYVFYHNRWGKTNLLSSITTPLHASYSFQYARTQNTFENPHSRWVISGVSVNDGVSGDGVDVQSTRYTYQDGYYDRLDREFYGYRSITEETLDENTFVVQTIVHTYNNKPTDSIRPFVLKGMVISESVFGSDGKEYQRTEQEYYSPVKTITRFVGSKDFNSYVPELKRTKTTSFDEGRNELITAISYADYDDWGNPKTIVDEGRINGSGNDQDNILIEIQYANFANAYIHSLPASLKVSGSDPLSGEPVVLRERNASYDFNTHNLESLQQTIKGSENAKYTYEYDPIGNGNVIKMNSPDGYWTSYKYDAQTNSRITQITDAHGLKSSVEYNPRWGAETVSTDTNGVKQTKSYDDFGRLWKIWGAYDVDAAGNPISSIPTIDFEYHLPSSSPAYAISKNKIHYDSRTQVIETVLVSDGIGRVIQTKKTGVVMQSGIKHPGMNVSGLVVYDALGRTVAQGQPWFEDATTLNFTAFPSLKNATITNYDMMGRVKEVKLPKTTQSGFTYIGDYWTTTNSYSIDANKGLQITTRIDPMNNSSTMYEDPRGNKVQLDRKIVNDIARIESTKYTYDLVGQIRQIVDTNANEINVNYDMMGRRIDMTTKDNGTTKWFWDPAGNLLGTEDARGLRITSNYDRGRLLQTNFMDHEPTIYQYGTDASKYNIGRVIAVNTPYIKTTVGYGKLGETVSLDKNIRHQFNTTEWTNYHYEYVYDYLGRAASMTYPNGELVSYGYDDGGQITNITGNHLGTTFNYVSDIGYDEFGQKNYIKYGNGVETTYTYEPIRRWLQNVKTMNESKGLQFQNTDFNFDAVGNILGINNKASPKGFTQTYTYDDLYQLKTADGEYTDTTINGLTKQLKYHQDFKYDTIANLMQKVSTCQKLPDNTAVADLTYTLDYTYQKEFPHRAWRIGNEQYAYDAVGNLTGISMVSDNGTTTVDPPADVESVIPDTEGTASANTAFGQFDPGAVGTPPKAGDTIASFDWDTENRLLHSKVKGMEAWYVYDSEGQRISKRSTQSQTLYPDKTFQETITAYPAQTISHIFLGDTRICSKVGLRNQTSGGYEAQNTYWFHADHLGSTEWVSDYNGRGFEHFLYTPHGESFVTEDADKLKFIEYRFSSKEIDEETGFYAFGARYLNPKTGLWLSGDPAMAEYLPSAGGDNSSLPGMGGVFNAVNLNAYTYAGNNPVRFVDPDGRRNISAAERQMIDTILGPIGTRAIERTQVIQIPDGRAGSTSLFYSGQVWLGKSIYENPLSSAAGTNTFIHEIFHQIQHLFEPSGFLPDGVVGSSAMDKLITEQMMYNGGKGLNVYSFGDYRMTDLSKYKVLADMPYYEAQAQMVGDFAQLFTTAKGGGKLTDQQTKAIKDMANILKNTGFNTEAVKWVQDNL